MSNEKTTPAPWLIARNQNYYYLCNTDGENILSGCDGDAHELAKANAKLAASAPVLRDIVEKQTEYIKFLSDEIGRKASYLECHGMGCSTEIIEQGIQIRKEIETLKQQL